VRIPVSIAVLLLGMTACSGAASRPPQVVSAPSLALTVTNTASSTPAPTATFTPSPTQTASATLTPSLPKPGAQLSIETMTPTSAPTWTLTPIPTPTASATPLPPSPVPGAQPSAETETPAPSPIVLTPTPSPSDKDEITQAGYRYLSVGPAQPDLSQPCPGCPRAPGYITGRVVDVGGNPLPGVRLVCYNSWHRYPVVGTKGSGEYDFPILQAEATWYVVVLDEADQPLSAEAPVDFNPLEACWYRLDWQRID
jgi:hypothetical protein